MDQQQPQTANPMTVIEAQEKLEEFKQKLIDEHYEALIQEGEAQVMVSFEMLEAIDAILYYVYSMSETQFEKEIDQ